MPVQKVGDSYSCCGHLWSPRALVHHADAVHPTDAMLADETFGEAVLSVMVEDGEAVRHPDGRYSLTEALAEWDEHVTETTQKRQPVKYEPVGGEHIQMAARRACDLRDDLRAVFQKEPPDVAFEFNGVSLLVMADSTPESVETEFRAALEREAATRDTPERRAEDARRAARAQRVYDEQVRGLLGVDLKDPRKAVRWLCRYEEVTSTVIDAHAEGRVLAAFRAAGYSPNAYLAKPGAEAEWVRKTGMDRKLRWLIGQALHSIRLMGAPHGITHHFAEQFGCIRRRQGRA